MSLARLITAKGWPVIDNLDYAIAWLHQEDIHYASDFAGAGILSELAGAPTLSESAWAVLQSMVDEVSSPQIQFIAIGFPLHFAGRCSPEAPGN